MTKLTRRERSAINKAKFRAERGGGSFRRVRDKVPIEVRQKDLWDRWEREGTSSIGVIKIGSYTLNGSPDAVMVSGPATMRERGPYIQLFPDLRSAERFARALPYVKPRDDRFREGT